MLVSNIRGFKYHFESLIDAQSREMPLKITEILMSNFYLRNRVFSLQRVLESL